MNKIFAAAVLLSLTGCATTIDTHIAGFPQDLTIRYYVMTERDMEAFCAQGMPEYMKLLGGRVLACSNVNLDTHTCDIYLTKYTQKYVIDHELEHCRGGDHDGILQRYFDKWTKDHAK